MPDPSTSSGSPRAESRGDWTEDLRPRLAPLRLSPTRESDIIEELSQHLDLRYQELLDSGTPDLEARRLAIEELREPEVLAQQMRTLRQARVPPPITVGATHGSLIANLWQDVRHAARVFRQQPSFAVTAVLTLALGIGVNNTVFTFVNAVLIRGLPFDEPDRIVSLGTRDARDRDGGVSFKDYEDWRRSARSFAGLAAFGNTVMNISDAGRTPERYSGPYISANAFALIGQQPLLGRDFTADDDRPGAEPVVILGHGVWRTRYGSDPSIVGRTIKVNEVLSTVVGVMPEGFKFPVNADLWVPIALSPNLAEVKRDVRYFQAFGRLAPRVTVAQAGAELEAIAATLAHDYPDTNKDVRATVMTFNERYNGGALRLVLLTLMGAVGFVLLIACANVANLLLARSAQRAREVSVRVSLGATRSRIVQQLLVESVLLALISGVLGLALSLGGIRLFAIAFEGIGAPYWIQFTLDRRVFAFLSLVALGTAFLFGLAPALHLSKTDVNEVLKDGGRSGGGALRTQRWSGALVVAELALTLVLLAGAGFMMRSFVALYRMDLGIDTSQLVTMRLALANEKYPTPERKAAFYDRIDERLAALPGVKSATIATSVPLGGGPSRQLDIEAQPRTAGEGAPEVTMVLVGPRYFETIGLPLMRGRPLISTDGAPGHEAVVVNQRFVAMHAKGEDPLGLRIRLIDASSSDAPPAYATIVGIVPSLRQRDVHQAEPDPVVYVPFRAEPTWFMSLVVRTEGRAADATALIREQVQAVDADMPLFDVRTMDDMLAQQRWPFRVFGTMFAIFALIALILAAVGLYAVTAYAVTQRVQEIGVRMALGARSGQVVWLILRRVLVQLTIGLVLGIAGAVGVGRVLGSLLVQTSSTDPVTLTGISIVLLGASIVACIRPAYRATRLDPVAALRSD
jgi:putative ABC transport system permease protein